MIRTRKEYKNYLKWDALALRCIKRKYPISFKDNIWTYQRLLRKCEYQRTFSGLKKLLCTGFIIFNKFRLNRLGLQLGFSIPIGVFEE